MREELQSRTALELFAPAKVNLTLEVIGKRSDGFHEIRSVMTVIPLGDTVKIALNHKVSPERGDEMIRLTSDQADLSCGPDNTCYKAALIMLEAFKSGGGREVGVDIRIEKRIPLAGGLGGSSTDAAAVIRGLNRLLKLKMSRRQLLEYAARVGSDAPFFILGGMAFVSGRGERVLSLSGSALPYALAIVLPGEKKWLAKDSYEQLPKDFFQGGKKNGKRINLSKEITSAIKKGEMSAVPPLLHNDLELSKNTDIMYIEGIKRDLLMHGAIAALMSGSGPAVYGIFANNKTLAAAAKKLSVAHKIISLPFN